MSFYKNAAPTFPWEVSLLHIPSVFAHTYTCICINIGSCTRVVIQMSVGVGYVQGVYVLAAYHSALLLSASLHLAPAL